MGSNEFFEVVVLFPTEDQREEDQREMVRTVGVVAPRVIDACEAVLKQHSDATIRSVNPKGIVHINCK